MSIIKKIFSKKQQNYINELKELFANDFNVMVIPTYQIFNNTKSVQLRYPYDSAQEYYCIREDYIFQDFDTAYYLRCIKESKCIIIEIKNLGSLIFTNHLRSDLFYILQRDYRTYVNYVFEGNDTGGYFKILKGGKIDRKIASYLIMDGIKNYPETRGKPCEYEIKKGNIWKVDMNAKYIADMLKGFYKEEVLDLFDYYVGLSNMKNENIQNVFIYSLEINRK